MDGYLPEVNQAKLPNPKWFIPAVIGLLLLIIMIALARAEKEPDWEELVGYIIQMESSGDSYAYNSKSQARGLCQITPICLYEYNSRHQGSRIILEEELFDSVTNLTVAKWYLKYIWSHYLPYYKLPQTIIYLLASFNWGIGNVVKWHKQDAKWNKLPKETRNYIIKYHRLASASKH